MDLYQQQQFGFFLQTATERFVERLEQRFRGAATALEKVKSDPNGDGVWVDEFTNAVFEDFLLNNIDGACFVLRSLAKRKTGGCDEGTVEYALQSLARELFAELLLQKTIEILEQHSGYQPVSFGAD
jgi:hypothetical protein